MGISFTTIVPLNSKSSFPLIPLFSTAKISCTAIIKDGSIVTFSKVSLWGLMGCKERECTLATGLLFRNSRPITDFRFRVSPVGLRTPNTRKILILRTLSALKEIFRSTKLSFSAAFNFLKAVKPRKPAAIRSKGKIFFKGISFPH